MSGGLVVVGIWLAFNLGLLLWFYLVGRRVPDELDTLQGWLERDALEGRIPLEAYFEAIDKARSQRESLR